MRVLITGSADGLGRLAAAQLLADGDQVVVHVRSIARRRAVAELTERGADVVVGDVADDVQTRQVADQANALGRMDTVIHNAGIYTGSGLLHINVVAPYLLTALLARPERLVYLTSGVHRSGRPRLAGLDWSGRRPSANYPDSKLFVSTLAASVARLWPDVYSNSVDPG